MRRSLSARRGDGRFALGLFLLSLGIYLLSGPGRIDIIDGQIRYEATRTWLETGAPELRDPVVRPYGLKGRDGKIFASYNSGPSVAAATLVWLAGTDDVPSGERARFLFSLTSAFFGAATVVLVFLWLRRLGVETRRSIGAALVAAFATYLWPLATTTFDQGQHALLLTAGLFCAWRAGCESSLVQGLLTGACFGALLNYQETYILLWPVAVLLMLRGRSVRERPVRLVVLVSLLPLLAGIAALFAFNELRFGMAYFFDRGSVGISHPPILGNPVVGLVSLLASPGKSILLYSPVLILGVLGLRSLRERDRWLAHALVAASGIELAFISCLSFFGSDWAWGPRYLGPLLAFWMLPATLWRQGDRFRVFRGAIVVAGVVVQLLGLSLDTHRFFYEHRLSGFFWYSDHEFYFRHSALFERPGEIVRAWQEAASGTAHEFAPTPERGLVTYLALGNRDRDRAPTWIRGFRLFQLPRPWPFWMATLEPSRRPVPLRTTAGLAAAIAALGFALTWPGLRRSDPRPQDTPALPPAF